MTGRKNFPQSASPLKRKESGGGSFTEGVQSFILEHCIKYAVGESNAPNHAYIKNILKKVIIAVEASYDVVLDGLYEQYAYYMTSFKDDDLLKGNRRIYKHISFLLADSHNEVCSRSMDLVVPLQCSLNMLEGDTGCVIWPSSLFLSEFILSYPHIFCNKFCFEVGAGVGLVGICLSHVKASKVILSDGDLSSLANMKLNLELNQLSTYDEVSMSTCSIPNLVECKYLPWESTSEIELQGYQPDIVLGADIIYDPTCLPHLIRVFSILLNPKKSLSHEGKANYENSFGFGRSQVEDSNNNLLPSEFSRNEVNEAPIAYIATVIRNIKTFNYFLKLAGEAHLSVVDITETRKPLNLLPYMLSYDRACVRLYRISISCDCNFGINVGSEILL